MNGYNLYVIYSFKRFGNPLILLLDLMYGDLIYFSNQAKICALQERDFGRVL